MVECGGLENRYPAYVGSRVQISPSPPFFTKASGLPGRSYEKMDAFSGLGNCGGRIVLRQTHFS